MYATLTTTTGPGDETPGIDVMVGEAMVEWLRDIDGFEGLIMLGNGETDSTHVITFWESREVAERHQVARMKLRDRVTTAASVEVELTQSYDVTFAQLRELREPQQPS